VKPQTRLNLVKALQKEEDRILETKAKEYANEEDTLANFKIIAEILNVAMPLPNSKWKPSQICAVYWLKHILAMLDNMNREKSLSEGLRSRALDARVYTTCMYCLGVEEDIE